MRILLLGNAASIHTVKWINGLASRGHEVHLATQDDAAEHRISDEVKVHRMRHGGGLGYFRNSGQLRRLVAAIGPDVVNAHYASGYGTTLNLARLKKVPTVMNVWGSDVYEFPHTSWLHRALIRSNLRRPTRIASTSRCMAKEIVPLIQDRDVAITPFGVDVEVFSPPESDERPTGLIGTIKKLDPIYGIDTLIEAFAKLESQVRLVIAGSGPDREALEALAGRLGVGDRVDFLGAIPNSEVPDLLGRLDVYVALSRWESFGVAVLEAAACSCPTLVSDADGPAEVVEDGTTGIIVARDDADAAAAALMRLLQDPDLARGMGEAGRRHVVANYSWDHCLDVMEGVYETAIADHRAGRRR